MGTHVHRHVVCIWRLQSAGRPCAQACAVHSTPPRSHVAAASAAGGGSGAGFRGKRESGVENRYSCVVLGGARSMDERRAALQVGWKPCSAERTSGMWV